MANAFRALVALVVTILFSTSVLAQNYQSLVDETKIKNPTELAQAIERSLELDPEGNDMTPEGLNTSPNGFLQAIKHADGDVMYVEELPAYLRALVSGPMPDPMPRLSRVDMQGTVDLVTGISRSARPGEVGWFEADTGKFILAGSCSNTPMNRTIVIADGVQLRDARSARVAYANARSCPGGDPNRRYFQVAMYESDAAKHPCAVDTMFEHGGRNRGSDPTAWGTPDTSAFSAVCGKTLHQAELADEITLGTVEHLIDIVVEDDGQEFLLFSGVLVGQKLTPASDLDAQVMSADGTAIFIPEEYQDGRVVVHFADYSKVRTPVASGVAYDISEFQRGCRVMRYTGIDL